MMPTAMMPKVMGRIVELAELLGARRIDLLDGCWECQIDAKWWVALNGHSVPTQCNRGNTVPALTLFVEFNGWPAGFVDFGGGIICGGDAANEATLVEAIETRIAREKAAVTA